MMIVRFLISFDLLGNGLEEERHLRPIERAKGRGHYSRLGHGDINVLRSRDAIMDAPLDSYELKILNNIH